MKDPSTITFLLVEDDEIDARAVKRCFQKNSISNPFIHAPDGIDALEHLRGENGKERLASPYIILLDLNMRRMNGFEFLEAVRIDPKLNSSPVFVLTTSNDDRDVVRAYESGVSGYILKSEAGKDFLNLVKLLEQFVLTVHFPPDARRTN